MVLGAEEFFIGNRRFLHGAEFRNRKVENLVDSFLGRARINGQHPGIGIRRDLAEDGVGEALPPPKRLFNTATPKRRSWASGSEGTPMHRWTCSRSRLVSRRMGALVEGAGVSCGKPMACK